jgi:hypothetical protein
MLMLGLSLCTTTGGCLALAAGAAGAGAGYMIGREDEEDDKPDEVHIHHDRGESPPNSVDID